MLGGTNRSTHPENEPDGIHMGIHQKGGAASPAVTNPIPLAVTSRLA